MKTFYLTSIKGTAKAVGFNSYISVATNGAIPDWDHADAGKATNFDAVETQKRLWNSTKELAEIEFYQNGMCYYEMHIKHDSRVAKKNIGRWGMVRNNWYQFKVNSIVGVGLPFIPDPTDSNNKHPFNPDPSKPIHPDSDKANIDIDITIAPWTYKEIDHNFPK